MTEFYLENRTSSLSMQRLGGKHKGRTYVKLRHGRNTVERHLTDQDLIRMCFAGLAEISKPESDV
jgi:hypothetical protein